MIPLKINNYNHMKYLIKCIFLVLSILVFGKIGLSQDNYALNISSSVSDNEKLLITYDIKASDGSKSFSVILILMHNGSKIDASSVYGDVGSNLSQGNEKAIVWYFKNDFEGNIQDVSVDVFAYKENEPQAIFKIVSTGNNGYAPSEIIFTNNSSYANEYQWDFGDVASGSKNLSFNKNPSHTFEKGGIFSIALIARNTQLKLENTYYQSIEIKTHETVVADFQIEGNNQLPPAKVKFNSTSVNADTYIWDFGDPASKKKNKSTDKNDDHKYTQAGNYTVKLTVKNNFSGLTDTITKKVIVAQEQVPVANFTHSKSTETAPSTVVFKNTSTSSNNYRWDFGDPSSGDKNTSKDIDPAHVYSKPGDYRVVLSAYANGKKKPVEFSEIINIKELPKPPKAIFSIENNNVFGPATIVFRNNSENATGYIWDFGDPESGNNNTSDKITPTHTYTKAGRYLVSLKVSNKNFNETSTVNDFVVITEPSKPPVAKFIIVNNNVTGPAEISFSNESLNANNYSWDFGDPSSKNNSSSEQNAGHMYEKSGRYKVILSATNKLTGEKSIFSDFVIVNEPAIPVALPEASFKIENNNLPSPAIVSFTSTSANAHSYLWDFGNPGSEENSSVLKNPVHIYSTAGRYMVTLTAKNDQTGQSDSYTDFVIVTKQAKPVIVPVASFSIETNETATSNSINFTSKSRDANSFEWNFGDPQSENNVSNEANPKHTFSQPGRYKVELKVSNSSSGLSNTFSDFVTISPPPVEPVSNFEIKNNNSTEPATVIFTNTAENANSFAWNFGDLSSGNQNSSSEKNPQHIYKKAGEYKVTLAALNKESGKEDVIEKIVKVEKSLLPPVAKFEITFNGEFTPITIEFKNMSSNADSFSWNFGDFDSDSNTSTERAPSHFYNKPGTYSISLEASNTKNGESITLTKDITLKSDFPTFVKSSDLPGNNSIANSLVKIAGNEFLVSMNDQNKNSTIVKIDNNGSVVKQKKLDYLVSDILAKKAKNKFVLAGVEMQNKLIVQNINHNFETSSPQVISENKNFKPENAPKLALSKTNEIGIIANKIDDKYPIDVLFQKTDNDGRIIPLIDRTFKYIGTKLATDFIETEDGGFAMIGYWQEKSTTPLLILFGKINKKGAGEMHLINSHTNNVGYDIEEAKEGYALLRVRENNENSNLFDLSFILIASDGGPTDCANDLPCSIKKEDVFKYKPTMVKTKDGYVIASHAFNGIDYNIRLFWIDETGHILINFEDIKLPNDEFVMDFTQTNDGGFLIIGSQIINGKNEALIIKTDAFGKIN
jgi:PKD repeat protein